MSKKNLKLIEAAVKNLPDIYNPTKVGIDGAAILAKDPKAKDGKGKPIKPKVHYYFTLPVKVNHYKKCKELIRGLPFEKINDVLIEYQEAVLVMYNKQKQEAEKEVQSV